MEKSIFNNPLQNSLTEYNKLMESLEAVKAFNDWYKTLPAWSEQDLRFETEDHIKLKSNETI